jgi:transcriptional antiterminator RfaH
MTTDQQHWYVVQSQPNAERKAVAHLNRQGFTTYLPRYLKRRRHARRVEMVSVPLFPSYLFVAIDMLTQRWRSIYSTTGVSRIVCNGDQPAQISARIVSGLKAREDEVGFIQLDQRSSLRSGDKIRVMEGVFTDILGLCDGMKDNERVAVLLDLLGRKVRVVLDVDSVAAV